MIADELCFAPATDLARAVRSKALSPVELAEAILAHVEDVNPRVNALCTVDPESVLAAAQQAEQQVMSGEHLGPLHGIPVAFKDVTETAGLRTTYGSRIFEHHVPSEDAIVVERVRAAGGIVLGKTNTPEFACKSATDNQLFGTTRNPWNLDWIAGGSSGGAAAAVAAGMGPLAEGTDQAGSIRIPAAMCGVVGYKPTTGRVPQYPKGNAWNTLNANGPLARTVRDAALLLQVWVGQDDRDPISLPATGEDFVAVCDEPLGQLRLAWTPDLGYAAVQPEVAAIASRAARVFESVLGCSLEEAAPGFEDPESLFLGISAAFHIASLGHYGEAQVSQMDPLLQERMRVVDALPAGQYEALHHRRTELYHSFRRFFERFDLLLTPTISIASYPIDAPYPPRDVAGRPIEWALGWYPFTFPLNLAGLPAITVPAGWTERGEPVGLQIAGPRLADALVLRAAAAFEAAQPWVHRRPAL